MKRRVVQIKLLLLGGRWLAKLPHKEPHSWWLDGEGLPWGFWDFYTAQRSS